MEIWLEEWSRIGHYERRCTTLVIAPRLGALPRGPLRRVFQLKDSLPFLARNCLISQSFWALRRY
jgi:hypothetical protein